VTGWVFAHRPSNRQRNAWVVSLLDVQPADRILEIGFGPGIAIARLTRAGADHVFGIDHSDVMLRQASKRNAVAIRAGKVTLINAPADRLPPTLGALNTVFAVNSLGFWPDARERLTELRALLVPGGRMAVASQPRCPGATADTSRNASAEIEDMLKTAGFERIRTEILHLSPPVICVLATAPDPAADRTPRP
jgi:ubiquinone/menaquinone biosynthesis C-methylase UbiE